MSDPTNPDLVASALEQLGYEIVPDDVDTEFDWSDENTVPIEQVWEPVSEPEQGWANAPTDTGIDPDLAIQQFNAHIDQLEQQTGLKMRETERKQLMLDVMNSGPFHPAATENLFYQRFQDHETGLADRSRDPELSPEMRRRARRERIARTMDRGA